MSLPKRTGCTNTGLQCICEGSCGTFMTESTPRKMLAIGQQHGIEAKLLSPDEVWISSFFS